MLSKCLFLLFLCVCYTSCDSKKSNYLGVQFLIRPTLGMFGDSIQALWPAEEMLFPFIPIKTAFPVRKSHEIYGYALENSGKYNAFACSRI